MDNLSLTPDEYRSLPSKKRRKSKRAKPSFVSSFNSSEAIVNSDRSEVTLFVNPVGKPRQSQSDKWKRRPCVVKYRAFADVVRDLWPEDIPFPDSGGRFEFWIEDNRLEKSRAKDPRSGKPHTQKPDIDNLLKSLFDALNKDDSHIWNLAGVEKRWTDPGKGRIIIHLPKD